MTARKSLPVRPSLESLRKQAKKLAHETTESAVDAIARARAQLPNVELPLSQRNAQLVIAREYGFAGWQDLRAEVLNRAGKGLDWAATQAKHAIHNNDTEGLKRLLAGFPELVLWRDREQLSSRSSTDIPISSRYSRVSGPYPTICRTPRVRATSCA